MGRPPIGKVRMTGAERTRLWRERTQPAKPAAKDEVATLRHELARAKAEIANLKATTKNAPTAKPTKRDDEVDRLMGSNSETQGLMAALGPARKEIAGLKAKLATVPPEQRDAELARLRNDNQALRAKNKHLSSDADAKVRAAEMPKAVKSALQKALTAEPTKADVDALTLLMDWVNRDAQAARKRPR
jgi:hypothetical protein